MKRKFLLILFIFVMATTACNNQENALDRQDQAQPIAKGRANNTEFLSSAQTTIPSFDFPHTKPIQIQEAKYDFEIDAEQIHLEELYELNLDENIENIQQQLQDQLQINPEPTPELQRPELEQRQAQEPQPEPEQPQAPEPESEQEQEEPEPDTDQEVQGISQEEQRVVELTNQHRRDAGLSELQVDTELSTVARKKSVDMHENNYFSHTSPTYGSPFDMIRDHGVQYNSAGENIAQGQQSAEQAVQGWMDSQGHRENILNGGFTHIGVGYDSNGNHWTQMFISR
ncbi:CAP domain-containing protein [Salipaludibacillus daqingensis]|uniref:CAP domain-containing protein n=1 Tax=Salipaludibacillus daqingensis TaxID=3041001 RepID=UPI002476748E|nr:CAP domain-containing protein [Salipaludibacillus daqingensis]